MTILLLVLVGFIAAELYVFAWTAGAIGILPCIGATLFTAAAGLFVVRLQGIQALRNAERSLAQGETPLVPVVDGIGLLFAGIFLAMPGFLTDCMGIALLIPPVRLFIGRRVLEHLKARIHVAGMQTGGFRPRSGGGPTVIDLTDADWDETTESGTAAEAGDTNARLRAAGDHVSQPDRPDKD